MAGLYLIKDTWVTAVCRMGTVLCCFVEPRVKTELIAATHIFRQVHLNTMRGDRVNSSLRRAANFTPCREEGELVHRAGQQFLSANSSPAKPSGACPRQAWASHPLLFRRKLTRPYAKQVLLAAEQQAAGHRHRRGNHPLAQVVLGQHLELAVHVARQTPRHPRARRRACRRPPAARHSSWTLLRQLGP